MREFPRLSDSWKRREALALVGRVGAVLAGASLAGASLVACKSKMPASLRHPLVGDVAPEFELGASDDEELLMPPRPEPRATLVDFWASWCAACRATLPAYGRLYRQRQADGLEVIAVSVDESEADALAFMRAIGGRLPLVLDSRGELASLFRVGQVPLTFLIDRERTVRWVGRSPTEAELAVDFVLDG